MKALTERCKKHGLEVESTAMVKLPIGTLLSFPSLFFFEILTKFILGLLVPIIIDHNMQLVSVPEYFLTVLSS